MVGIVKLHLAAAMLQLKHFSTERHGSLTTTSNPKIVRPSCFLSHFAALLTSPTSKDGLAASGPPAENWASVATGRDFRLCKLEQKFIY